MELFWYTVFFLTFWSRAIQAAPLAVNCPTKLYAPCSIVQQSDFMDPEVSSLNIPFPHPYPSLEKASLPYPPPYAQNDIDDHNGDNKVTGDIAAPESEDEKENARLYCSCVPVLNSDECYSLALPVLVMMALGLAVHYILKGSRENTHGKKNEGSNYSSLSSSYLEKNEVMVSSDGAQDQDVESFDDSNFPMG